MKKTTKRNGTCFDFSNFTHDRKASVEGREVSYPGIDEAKFRIASITYNPAFEAAVREAENRIDEHGDLTDLEQERIRLEPYARHILLGWSGNVGANGTALAPTYENRLEALAQAPHFAGWVIRMARDVSLFRGRFLETDQGN